MSRNTSNFGPNHGDSDSHEAALLVFGEKVRRLMNDFNMSQSDLARAAGLRRDAISTYIRGKVWPSPQNLSKLARALQVTPSELRPGASEIDDVIARRPVFGHRFESAPARSLQFMEVEEGQYRLTFDRVISYEKVHEILTIVNRKE